MRIIVKVTILCSLLFYGVPALGCTCNIYSHRRDFRQMKAVFLGTVLSLGPNTSLDREFISNLPFRVEFKIEKVWKGRMTSTVVAYTENGLLGCSGTHYRVGARYLVYAYYYQGRLDASTGCMRTRPVTTDAEKADKELKQLDSWWFRFRASVWPFFRGPKH